MIIIAIEQACLAGARTLEAAAHRLHRSRDELLAAGTQPDTEAVAAIFGRVALALHGVQGDLALLERKLAEAKARPGPPPNPED